MRVTVVDGALTVIPVGARDSMDNNSMDNNSMDMDSMDNHIRAVGTVMGWPIGVKDKDRDKDHVVRTWHLGVESLVNTDTD